MDVQVLQRRGTGPVQVLNQVCEKPSRVSRCTPISSTLQRSLEVAIHRSIVWVDHRRTKGPEFWVFAPVTFGGGTASAEYAFWDPGALGCFGGSSEDWALRQGAWSPTIASAWVGCPAT
jgi:hypothetical protein